MYRHEAHARKVLDIPDGQYGENVMAYCPFHDNQNSPSLRINLDSGLWVCYVCKRRTKDGVVKSLGGNIKHLYSRLGKELFSEGVDLDDLSRRLDVLKKNGLFYNTPGEISPSVVSKNNRLLKVYISNLHIVIDTLRAWGITDHVCIDDFELGYNIATDSITYPIRDVHGTLLGFIERDIEDSAYLGPKYRNPKGVKKTDHLYGAHLCEGNRPLVIVEGPKDVLRTYQAVDGEMDVVGQLGSALSEQQASIIQSMSPTSVTTMYDGDDAGRRASEVARSVLRGQIVLTVTLREGWDPGAMDDEHIRRMLGIPS